MSTPHQISILLTHASKVGVAWIALALGICIYRIYLSPLSKIPGPKLAAATLLYEGYFDLIEDGTYPWKIRDMHKKYGPVVRVNPREVHIQDPDFVDKLYKRPLDKDPWFTKSFGCELASQSTWSHNVHRGRRAAINRFFSKASIASRAATIQKQVDKLCEHLETYRQTGQVAQMDAGFVCLTVDVITEFCYGACYNYLDVPGFDKSFREMIASAFGAGAFNRQVPWLFAVMNSLPLWAVKILAPKLKGIIFLQEESRRHGEDKANALKQSLTLESADDDDHDGESTELSRHRTIFDQILSSRLPKSEKSLDRLAQEGQVMVAAGAETTARTLYVCTVHLLQRPQLVRRLRTELKTVMPTATSTPSLQQLEQLPFLTAVIKESIRLGGSAMTRLSRISPSDEPIVYGNYVFPPGTPVSVTLFDVLMDPDIFPRPEQFDPDRWLLRNDNDQWVLNSALDRYMVAFSRGPRSCVGMWLAWAELYLTTAAIYRRLDLELYETDVSDVAAARDKFSCFAKAESRGVRVKVAGAC